MAVGSIKIIGYEEPSLSFSVEGFNLIPLPQYTTGYNIENYDQEVKTSRKLTWRDFTIDMNPFDYKYARMTGFDIVEYGTYNINNIMELTPDSSLKCLSQGYGVTTVTYSVGDYVPLAYDNVTSTANPSNVREDSLPIEPVYLTPIFTGDPVSAHYAMVRLRYNGIPSNKVKVIYNIAGSTNPRYLGVYENIANIEVLPNTVASINFEKLLEGLNYQMKALPALSTSTPWTTVLNNITQPSQDFYSNLFPDLYMSGLRGNPLKITIWDNNVNKRILINGAPLVNGMSIPFTDFTQGFVMFNSIGMTPTEEYVINWSIMDLISGSMVLTF